MQIGVDKLDIKENITNYLINDSLDEDTQSFMFFVTKLFKLDEDDEDNGSGSFTMDDLLKMIKFLYEKKGITNFKNLVKMANFKRIFPNNPKNATKLLNNVMGLMAKSNFSLTGYDKLRNQKLIKNIKGGGNLIDNLFEKIKARVNLFKINKTKMGAKVSKLEIKSLKDRIVKAFKLAEKVLKFAKKISTKFANLKKSAKLETSREETKSRGGSKDASKGKEDLGKIDKGASKEREDARKSNKGEDREIKRKTEENKTETKNKTEENKKSESILSNNTSDQRTSFDRELANFINNNDTNKFSSYEKTSSQVRDEVNKAVSSTNERNNELRQNNEKTNEYTKNTEIRDKKTKDDITENDKQKEEQKPNQPIGEEQKSNNQPTGEEQKPNQPIGEEQKPNQPTENEELKGKERDNIKSSRNEFMNYDENPKDIEKMARSITNRERKNEQTIQKQNKKEEIGYLSSFKDRENERRENEINNSGQSI